MTSAIMAAAIQTAKGTPAASSIVRFGLSGGLVGAPVKTSQASDGVTGGQRLPLSVYADPLRAQGDPELILRPLSVGVLLYGALGAKAVSGASDPWTHTFTPATTQPWLTFWQSLGSVINERHSDCKLTYLRISSRTGQPVRVTFGYIGINSVFKTAAETTATLEQADPFFHYMGQGALLVDGTAVTRIDDWDLQIDTGATYRDTLAAYDVRTGPRLIVTARVSQVIINDDLWARNVYGSASPSDNAAASSTPWELTSGLSFKLTEQTSPERSIQVVIPRVVVTRMTPPAYDGQGSPPRVEAYYTAIKPAAGAGITVTLKNNRSSY